MAEPSKDPGQANIEMYEGMILDAQTRLQQTQTAIAELQAKLAGLNANTPAYKNITTSLKNAQSAEVALRGTIAGYQEKIAATRLVVDARNNPPPKPQTEEERALGIANIQERAKNKAAGHGNYTDKELEGFKNDAAARGAATTNAETNAANAAEAARHNKVVEDYNASVAKVNADISSGKLKVEQGQLLLNQKYNDAKIAFDRIEAENKAATTLVQAESTERGQDVTEAQGIRSQVGTNTGNYLDFLKSVVRYLPKGKILTWDDINKLSASWDDMNQGQVAKAPRTPKSPDSSAKESLKKTAEGAKTEPIKTVGEMDAATPRPEPGSVDEAIDTVKGQYDEWMAAGGDGDWAKFQEHATAIGSSAPGERPASISAPEPAAPPETPASTYNPPTSPPPALPQRPESIQAPTSQVPSGVGGITINVGGQPQATPVAPPVAPPVANPEQDEDFNTANSAATYDLLDGIVDEEVRNKYRVEPNQWGAFTQSIMGQL
jgi:hypothetical protein